MDIGTTIKTMRLARNLEQKDLARALNVSNKTISSWECGRTEPKMGMIEMIADYFGISKSEFLDGKPIGENLYLSNDEMELIIEYRSYNDEEKRAFKAVMAYQKRLSDEYREKRK